MNDTSPDKTAAPSRTRPQQPRAASRASPSSSVAAPPSTASRASPPAACWPRSTARRTTSCRSGSPPTAGGCWRATSRPGSRSAATTCPQVDAGRSPVALMGAADRHRPGGHRAGQRPVGHRRGRRGLPAAPRPVGRGRHPAGDARDGRRALRRLRRARLRDRHGQGLHEGRPAGRRSPGHARHRRHPHRVASRTRSASVRGSRSSASRRSPSPPAPARAWASARSTTPRRSTTALEEAFRHDPKVLVEQSMEGAREVECGVLGTLEGPPETSRPGEVRTGGDHEFYDFEAKYLADQHTEIDIPADLPRRDRAGAARDGGARLRGAVVRGSGARRLLRDARRLAGDQRAQHDARLHADLDVSRSCGPRPACPTPTSSTGSSSSRCGATPASAEAGHRYRQDRPSPRCSFSAGASSASARSMPSVR